MPSIQPAEIELYMISFLKRPQILYALKKNVQVMLLTSSDTVVTSWVLGTLQSKTGGEVTKCKSMRWDLV